MAAGAGLAPHRFTLDSGVLRSNMPTERLCLALAQAAAVPGDVDANVAAVVAAVSAAAIRGANLVVFPELFLTGYELAHLESTKDAWLEEHDPRLDPVRRACARGGVTAILGAALQTRGGDRHIAAPIVGPSGDIGFRHSRCMAGGSRSASASTSHGRSTRRTRPSMALTSTWLRRSIREAKSGGAISTSARGRWTTGCSAAWRISREAPAATFPVGSAVHGDRTGTCSSEPAGPTRRSWWSSSNRRSSRPTGVGSPLRVDKATRSAWGRTPPGACSTARGLLCFAPR